MSVFSSCGVSDKPLSEALVPGKRQHQTKLLGVNGSTGQQQLWLPSVLVTVTRNFVLELSWRSMEKDCSDQPQCWLSAF